LIAGKHHPVAAIEAVQGINLIDLSQRAGLELEITGKVTQAHGLANLDPEPISTRRGNRRQKLQIRQIRLTGTTGTKCKADSWNGNS
jgi:hypothetical protein